MDQDKNNCYDLGIVGLVNTSNTPTSLVGPRMVTSMDLDAAANGLVGGGGPGDGGNGGTGHLVSGMFIT